MLYAIAGRTTPVPAAIFFDEYDDEKAARKAFGPIAIGSAPRGGGGLPCSPGSAGAASLGCPGQEAHARRIASLQLCRALEIPRIAPALGGLSRWDTRFGLLCKDAAFLAALGGTHVWRGDQYGHLQGGGQYLHIGFSQQADTTLQVWCGEYERHWRPVGHRISRILNAVLVRMRRSGFEGPASFSLKLRPASLAIAPGTIETIDWRGLNMPVENVDETSMSCLVRALIDIGVSRNYQKLPFTQGFVYVLCSRLIDFLDQEPLPHIARPFVAWFKSQLAATCLLGKQIAEAAPSGPVLKSAPGADGTASD
jgi:hypothetical protein